jgi:hypothetical protein
MQRKISRNSTETGQACMNQSIKTGSNNNRVIVYLTLPCAAEDQKTN